MLTGYLCQQLKLAFSFPFVVFFDRKGEEVTDVTKDWLVGGHHRAGDGD
jgi:hypothetical protein